MYFSDWREFLMRISEKLKSLSKEGSNPGSDSAHLGETPATLHCHCDNDSFFTNTIQDTTWGDLSKWYQVSIIILLICQLFFIWYTQKPNFYTMFLSCRMRAFGSFWRRAWPWTQDLSHKWKMQCGAVWGRSWPLGPHNRCVILSLVIFSLSHSKSNRCFFYIYRTQVKRPRPSSSKKNILRTRRPVYFLSI